jgi:hypothetical protein
MKREIPHEQQPDVEDSAAQAANANLREQCLYTAARTYGNQSTPEFITDAAAKFYDFVKGK